MLNIASHFGHNLDQKDTMNGKSAWKILCLTLACCMAAPSVAAEPTNSRTLPAADDKQQLLELEQEWVTAENKHDAATLRRILDDKFVSSFGVKKPIDKEAFIREIVSGDVDPAASQALTDRTVIIDNDTAVVVGTDTAHGIDHGTAYSVVFRYTVTYIRRHGQWFALAEHLVKVPDPKQAE
jgi:hypothetical protein